MVNPGIVRRTHLVRVMAMAALASLAWVGAGCNKPAPVEESQPVPEFGKRISAYLELREKATADLPALKTTGDPVEITTREVAMGEAIRRARANAKPGDIMTPEVATYFRRLIRENFKDRTPEERKLMLDEIPPFQPAVNQTYPPDHPFATFPGTLLKIMPTLPEGLEYRFLRQALIIRDVKANIIVDFISDVF